jgi:hypothetical protein
MANDILIAYLDEFDTKLSADIAMHARGDKNNKGFNNNDSMIWYIKAWTKIAIIVKGNGYWRDYRYCTLYDSLSNDASTINQDVFKHADDAVMDFFYDYRQHTVGMKDDSINGEKDFIKRVKQWTVAGPGEAAKQPIFDQELALTRGD